MFGNKAKTTPLEVSPFLPTLSEVGSYYQFQPRLTEEQKFHKQLSSYQF